MLVDGGKKVAGLFDALVEVGISFTVLFSGDCKVKIGVAGLALCVTVILGVIARGGGLLKGGAGGSKTGGTGWTLELNIRRGPVTDFRMLIGLRPVNRLELEQINSYS